MAALPNAYLNSVICLTGGAGFIGSHLCEALVRSGARVRVVDDFTNGVESNLAAVADDIERIDGCVTDPAVLDRALRGASTVFHLAAMGGVPRSLEMPEQYHRVNVGGTMALLQSAVKHGVRRVVYAGSSSAYGNTPTLPKVETMRPDPLSPYACTKLAGEHLMRAWANCFGIETISLRYFNIFGPRQRHDSPYAAVIPVFAQAIREGRPLRLYGDGTQTRDFTFVANAVHANLLAGSVRGPLSGEVLNIACGTRFSLIDLIRRMSLILERPAKVEHLPPRGGDVRDSEADIRLARDLIGYQVQVPFEQGLRATLAS